MLYEKLLGNHISNNWVSFVQSVAGNIRTTSTGIDSLDAKIGGLAGSLCIRGAPGSNKSTLATQIALNFAKNYGPVLFVDEENGINRLRERLLCCEAKVSQAKLREIAKTSSELPSEKLLVDLPFYVVSQKTEQDVGEYYYELLNFYNKPVLVVLDSIQSMPYLAQDAQQSTISWVRFLDSLKVANPGNIFIIWTSEKTKSAFESQKGLGGSADSRSIEYKAEIVIDIQPDIADDTLLSVWVVKNRDYPPNQGVSLSKVYFDPIDNTSFCFRLGDQW